MKSIILPSQIQFTPDEKNKNKAILIVEPLYPAYGITLGNALRRILLSSLLGAAVTAVKIKDVNHEFSTIPGIKEDTLELILNLKNLHLKIFSDLPVILNLKAKGEKKIKAGDIERNPEVEIVNPELEIANLTDKKAKIEMQIWAEKGRGYLPVEERKEKNKELGVMFIDSIFTPIKNVGLQVENVRVGQRTDYDKLILDIETNGTLTPQEAVSQASEILIEQLGLFIEKKKEEAKVEEFKEEAKVEEFKEEAKVEEFKEEKEETKEEIKAEKIEKVKEEEKPKKKRGRPKKAS